MIHNDSMRLKLFKINAGEQTHQIDYFKYEIYFEITSVTFLTNHLYKLILKHDCEEMVQYTNGESIDITHFQNKHSNISITSNCNGILEITYKKMVYMGNPISDIYNNFIRKCTQKYYDALFTKKKCVDCIDFLYIDRKTFVNLKLHYSDVEFMNHYNEFMQKKNDYVNVSGRTCVYVNGDIILGIEINAVEQTVCNISLNNDIFLSFNVKQGKHDYDIFTFPYNVIRDIKLWFENDHVNIIKYKWVSLPNIIRHKIWNEPMISHCDMYTPDLLYYGFCNYPMESISKAKHKGMMNAICSMILALNDNTHDNKSNLQMLNHDILFNILCQLKTLLF